jgi:hemerythrin superfamily protein
MAASDQSPESTCPASALTLRDRMADDHQRIQALFERLIELLSDGDWDAANNFFTDFERRMLSHIDGEERYMLPHLQRDDPFEAAAVLEEHRRIREHISDLGVQLELHSVRQDHAQKLFDLHRAHAAREERVLYRWADGTLPAESTRSILERISHHITSALFF